jgi:hypothetical protein
LILIILLCDYKGVFYVEIPLLMHKLLLQA